MAYAERKVEETKFRGECDCGGGVVRDSVAVGCRWFTSGMVRTGCGAVCGRMGIALRWRLILPPMHAMVIRHAFDGIGSWCWVILDLNSI